jgi:hypothetical protein
MDPATARRVITPALTRFAMRLQEAMAAEHVFLFGGGSCALEPGDVDYDLIIVSSRFAGIDRRKREIGLRELWYEAGGEDPLDLICVTPEEFERARNRITLVAAVLPEAIDLLSPEQPAA